MKFEYRAQEISTGKVIKNSVDAESKQAVLQDLRKQ